MSTNGWLFAKVKLAGIDENPTDESIILGQLTPEGEVSMKVYVPVTNDCVSNGDEIVKMIRERLAKKGKAKVGKRVANKRKVVKPL